MERRCPRSSAMLSPELTIHRLIISHPLANIFPSGEKHTHSMEFFPSNVLTISPVSVFQSIIFLSIIPPEAIILPSGEQVTQLTTEFF